MPPVRALIVTVGLALMASPADARDRSPQVLLERGHRYLALSLDQGAPSLLFHRARAMNDAPALKLDLHGLFAGDKPLCRWPTGDFAAEQSFNMVLGYEGDVARAAYVGCGEGLPLISTWGDGGTGTAVIYLEVAREHENALELLWQGKPVFLRRASLPAKARWIRGEDVQAGR